jgi:hypothetical protein
MPYKPICFMVMPFGVKPTKVQAAGAPLQVNFDRVWNELFKPLISEDLNYEPVRADADLGASISREMIERLTLSDLVLADLTLPNANVFYEVGVRHAACEKGCVLVAADWARQPFDTQSMRHEKYALAGENITDEEARSNRAQLAKRVKQLAGSKTPCYELDGFPKLSKARTLAFQEELFRMNELNARVTTLRESPPTAQRDAGVQALLGEFKATGQGSLTVAFEFLKLVRDTCDWKATSGFVEQLPEAIRKHGLFVEQHALALAKGGDPFQGIVALRALIASDGATPEREGLLGGRYKQLWRTTRATEARASAGYLDQAIEHYERGRDLDLNEYYAASNLPLLLKSRGSAGDAERAARVATCVVAACERAIVRGTSDEYVYPTLLGAAFHAGDVAKARELAVRVRRDPQNWKLESTLADLADVLKISDSSVRDELAAVFDDLRSV